MNKKKLKNKVDSSAELKTRQFSQPFFGKRGLQFPSRLFILVSLKEQKGGLPV